MGYIVSMGRYAKGLLVELPIDNLGIHNHRLVLDMELLRIRCAPTVTRIFILAML